MAKPKESSEISRELEHAHPLTLALDHLPHHRCRTPLAIFPRARPGRVCGLVGSPRADSDREHRDAVGIRLFEVACSPRSVADPRIGARRDGRRPLTGAH